MSPRVDIHCHTFNGDDLPIKGFVRHVLLKRQTGAKVRLPDGIKDRLALWADQFVQKHAPGYDAEREVLERLLSGHDRGIVAFDVDEGAAEIALRNAVAMQPQTFSLRIRRLPGTSASRHCNTVTHSASRMSRP